MNNNEQTHGCMRLNFYDIHFGINVCVWDRSWYSYLWYFKVKNSHTCKRYVLRLFSTLAVLWIPESCWVEVSHHWYSQFQSRQMHKQWTTLL